MNVLDPFLLSEPDLGKKITSTLRLKDIQIIKQPHIPNPVEFGHKITRSTINPPPSPFVYDSRLCLNLVSILLAFISYYGLDQIQCQSMYCSIYGLPRKPEFTLQTHLSHPGFGAIALSPPL